MSNKSRGTGLFGWQYIGQQRPDFADEPKPGEESVWDYPRPPAIVDDIYWSAFEWKVIIGRWVGGCLYGLTPVFGAV